MQAAAVLPYDAIDLQAKIQKGQIHTRVYFHNPYAGLKIALDLPLPPGSWRRGGRPLGRWS